MYERMDVDAEAFKKRAKDGAKVGRPVKSAQ
jgi:hypothetical protein